MQNEGKVLTHELSWGKWDSKYPSLIIHHKGQDYVRLYSTPNKFKSTYYLNGRPIEVEKLKNMNIVQNSYWNRKEGSIDCLTVKTANIQEIF